jgi:hypothetical protein
MAAALRFQGDIVEPAADEWKVMAAGGPTTDQIEGAAWSIFRIFNSPRSG